MTPAEIIREAAADGVTLSLSATGAVKATGDGAAVNRWLVSIREHKAAIVDVLAVDLMTAEQEAAVRAWIAHVGGRDPELIAAILDDCRTDADALAYYLKRSDEIPKPVSECDDDRRLCTQCANLSPRGRCLAAQRGGIDRIPNFEPMPDKLQYCIAYAPGPEDPDRRSGWERWR